MCISLSMNLSIEIVKHTRRSAQNQPIFSSYCAFSGCVAHRANHDSNVSWTMMKHKLCNKCRTVVADPKIREKRWSGQSLSNPSIPLATLRLVCLLLSLLLFSERAMHDDYRRSHSNTFPMYLFSTRQRSTYLNITAGSQSVCLDES